MNQTDKVMGLADEYAVASQFEHNATKEREALRANIEAMQKDCRTCEYISEDWHCLIDGCTNHDQYRPAEFKQLTRKE